MLIRDGWGLYEFYEQREVRLSLSDELSDLLCELTVHEIDAAEPFVPDRIGKNGCSGSAARRIVMGLQKPELSRSGARDRFKSRSEPRR